METLVKKTAGQVTTKFTMRINITISNYSHHLLNLLFKDSRIHEEEIKGT